MPPETILTLYQPSTRALPPLDTRVEMFQKGYAPDSFLMKAQAPRPISNATEFDTDFEDEDINSDIEDIEEDYSPRISLNSVSMTPSSRSPLADK